ncbi:MAG: M1 family metallopeptidase [Pseudomonadota bacterium]|nr:M1 family metallopeptidase [Pseudomonadota bacterium]
MSRLAALALALLCPVIAQAKPTAACAEIPLASADAAAVHTPSAPTAWGGPRSGNESTRSQHVANYRIHARLDTEKHRIDGQQTLTWHNRSSQPVCALYLHLYLNAFSEGSTFLAERAQAGFDFRSGVPGSGQGYIQLQRVSQGGLPARWRFVQPDGGPASDKTVIRLELPTPVVAGASTTLDMDFSSQLPRVIARTGYFGSFHLVAQWFPKVAVLELPGERGATAPRWNAHEFHLHSEFYADFGHYDVHIDVPADYTVGATGELVEKRSANGRAVYRYVQGDVHDFAWTADRRTAKPLEAQWRSPTGDTVKLQVLYPPEYAQQATVVMQATLDALDDFARSLTPYPYRTLTAVIPPFNADEAGGMEYPTFFTAMSFPDFKPGGHEQHLLELVTLHELGHSYFQGILASNEFEEPLLDEGLNQYWNRRILRQRGQQVPLAPGWLARFGFRPKMDGFALERLAAGLHEKQDRLGSNSWQWQSSASYGTVYSRSATLFDSIERQVGSAAMERALQLYYQRWKFRHPSIADLRQALIDGTGQREIIERSFAQHVYQAAVIDDGISAFQSEKTDGQHYRTTITVQRRGADVPQTLIVRFADGSTETVRFSGAQDEFHFDWLKPVPAKTAQLDPQQHYPLDVSLGDNQRSLAPSPAARNLVMQRLLGWLQIVLAWLLGA